MKYLLAFSGLRLFLLAVVSAIGEEGGDGTVDTAEELLKMCPHFSRQAYTPTCRYGQHSMYDIDPSICATTHIYIGLWLDRFHEIDDVAETFSASGSVTIRWEVLCGNYTLPLYGAINLDEHLFWVPHVYHKNAVFDYGMHEENFAIRFYVHDDEMDEEEGVHTMAFNLQRTGVFTSTCRMDYALFPFDEQLLYVDFEIRENAKAARISQFSPLDTSDFFMPNGVSWTLVSKNSTGGVRELSKSFRSLASFQLLFRRKPDYFIYNLMLPACFLSCMQLGAFLLPTKSTDRPAFTFAIMLALTFHQGQVLARIPAKPQRIFLTNYTDLCSGFSWLCTLYALGAVALVETPEWRNWFSKKCDLKVFSLRRSRLMDLIAFLVAFDIFVAINVHALDVAYSANADRLHVAE